MGKISSLVIALAIILVASGCESQRPYQMDFDRSALRVAQRAEIGTVEAIEVTVYGEPVPVSVTQVIGWGTVGRTNDTPTAGDQLRVLVRLDSGAAVAATDVDEGEFHIGDRVRVVNNRVFPA